MVPRSDAYLVDLVRALRSQTETEWIEFKDSNSNPQEVGEYVSALANVAALQGKASGYLVWGVEDKTRRLIQTQFDPWTARVGAEEIQSWISKLLTPDVAFTFHQVTVDGFRIVILEIPAALTQPVQFQQVEYVRIGSYKKKLKDFPEKERELWRLFDRTMFEDGVALEHVDANEVVTRLDVAAYFQLAKRPRPDSAAEVVAVLATEAIVAPCVAGGWNITNLGALLFAHQLSDFANLARKAVRVIKYNGTGRDSPGVETLHPKGYAAGFSDLIAHVLSLVPDNEVIGQAFRTRMPMYPQLAVRELVVNALIHQNLHITGTGPMIEIFEKRMEVLNPGRSLVELARLLDNPPRSRNEKLASLMRRFGVCEERGSGVDKVVAQMEAHQLPAPRFEDAGDGFRAVAFSHRDLVRMDPRDRIRATYLHACLRWVQEDFVTNSSIRKRFGIEEQNMSQASRLIKEAVEANQIVAHDPNAGRRFMKYVPWWAKRI